MLHQSLLVENDYEKMNYGWPYLTMLKWFEPDNFTFFFNLFADPWFAF